MKKMDRFRNQMLMSFRQVCRLQKRVLAEGVETTEQLDVLRKIKCDEIQGFYYARPMTEAQFIEYVRKSDNHKKLQQRDTEKTTHKKVKVDKRFYGKMKLFVKIRYP